MEFSQVVRNVYNEYLLYLDDGGKRVQVIEPEVIHTLGYVHAGALMDCPLKANKERTNQSPVIPALAKRNNPTLLHRMQQGTRCAEPFQEAFVWKRRVMESFAANVYPECNLYSDEMKLQGRCDLMIGISDIDNGHIVEFKHRLPTWKDKTPQPRMGDVFQLLAYMKMTNIEEGHLVIINTPQYADFFDETKGFVVWTLYKDTEYSDGWILQDENMDVWNHQFNHGGYINSETLRNEISRQLTYINGLETPPIDLNSEERWQCLKITKYSKDNKVGIFHKQCSHWCHDNNTDENVPYVISEEGEFIIV